MTHGAPPGWRLHTYDTLASTQDAAIAAANAADPGKLAILAHEQTAGRGSRGRSWAGASGNLHLSVLLRPRHASPKPGFWVLMAGVVLHQAVASHVHKASDLTLKWPNDLLLDGAKLGGILIDSALASSNRLDWVVIGLGVNLRSAPTIEGRPTASLANSDVAPASLAASILEGFDRWMGFPLPALRDAWLDRAHPIGTWLDIATPAARHAGAFAGLSEDGGLLLAGRVEPITSGEVFATGGPAP